MYTRKYCGASCRRRFVGCARECVGYRGETAGQIELPLGTTRVALSQCHTVSRKPRHRISNQKTSYFQNFRFSIPSAIGLLYSALGPIACCRTFLSFRQNRHESTDWQVTALGLYFHVVLSSVRPSVTNVVNTIFWKRMNDFAANRHKRWSTGRGHERYQRWGAGGQRSRSHETEIAQDENIPCLRTPFSPPSIISAPFPVYPFPTHFPTLCKFACIQQCGLGEHCKRCTVLEA